MIHCVIGKIIILKYKIEQKMSAIRKTKKTIKKPEVTKSKPMRELWSGPITGNQLKLDAPILADITFKKYAPGSIKLTEVKKYLIRATFDVVPKELESLGNWQKESVFVGWSLRTTIDAIEKLIERNDINFVKMYQ
jgi:hypothetical protein